MEKSFLILFLLIDNKDLNRPYSIIEMFDGRKLIFSSSKMVFRLLTSLGITI